jgi:hypothetical protein
MTMVDEAPEVTVEPEDGAEPPRRGKAEGTDHGDRWWTNLPTMIIVALAFVVIAAAVLLYQQNQSLADERDDRRDAAQVAGDFTAAVLSYDYRDLGDSLDQVMALSTPDWGRQYENAWFSEQQGVIEELQAVAQVDVRDVMLGDEHDGAIAAVVLFNANIESQIGTRRLGGSYLRLDLVKHQGDWRVDNLAFLAATDQSLDPQGGQGGQGQDGATPTTVPGG